MHIQTPRMCGTSSDAPIALTFFSSPPTLVRTFLELPFLLSLDESDALSLTLPTGVTPESNGSLVILNNYRLKPDCSYLSESSNSRIDKLASETTSSMTGSHSEAVDGSPPTIPPGDHRSD